MTKKEDAAAIAAARAMMREMAESGRVLEGGWQALRRLSIPEDAPQTQIDSMRFAFFAGAQHLYACMLESADEGDGETPAELRRMRKIDAELRKWDKEFRKQHGA